MKRLRLLDGPLPLIEIEELNRLSDFLSPSGDMLAISELTPTDSTADLTPIPGGEPQVGGCSLRKRTELKGYSVVTRRTNRYKRHNPLFR